MPLADAIGRHVLVGQRTAELGATPAAVALAWLNSRLGIAPTLIRARRTDQHTANIAALGVTPTSDQNATHNAASKIALGFLAGSA